MVPTAHPRLTRRLTRRTVRGAAALAVVVALLVLAPALRDAPAAHAPGSGLGSVTRSLVVTPIDLAVETVAAHPGSGLPGALGLTLIGFLVIGLGTLAVERRPAPALVVVRTTESRRVRSEPLRGPPPA